MATRMQQRRGTAAQWTAANPILSAGEIGFESDTGQFKIGDGTLNWNDLTYFKNFDDLDISGYIKDAEKGAASGVASLDSNAQIPISQLSNIIQGAPAELNTLSELASGLSTAISDTATQISQLSNSTDDAIAGVQQSIQSAQTALETSINSVSDTLDGTNTTVAGHTQDIADLQTSVNGAISVNTTQGTTITAIEADITGLQTNVEDIVSDIVTINGNISQINTDITAAENSISTINSSLTSLTSEVSGLNTDAIDEATNLYFTTERAQDAVAGMIEAGTGVTSTYNDANNKLTVAVDSTISTKLYADNAVSSAMSDHNADTTNVHGISDTSALVVTTDSRLSDTRTPTDNTVSTAKLIDGAVTSAKIADGTIVNADINGSAAIATSKISGLDTALAAKAPLAAPALTGNATAENLTISGNLTVNGTTTTVSSANLELTDSLIYLSSTQYDTDVVDIGVYGAYGDSNAGHFHTGLIRDASDAKWKLISAGSEPSSNVIDFSGATYDTLQLGGVEFPDGIQVKQGVPSLTGINQQTGAYTPVLTDRDKMIEVASETGVTITIPTNASVAYPIGTSFDILQTSTGQITIAGAAGVTVNATPGLKLRTQWSSATVFKRAENTWVVYGDLSA